MFKAHCFSKAVILQAVYFKLRFSLSYLDVEELLRIRGMIVDDVTKQRWVLKFTSMIEMNFRKRKRIVGKRWWLDKTYIECSLNLLDKLVYKTNGFFLHFKIIDNDNFHGLLNCWNLG